MHKLICVVGPTATGKTKKAIELSRQTPSILVSADSRQVYRGMDIVTGKDHPSGIVLYGVDIVDPDDDCSVSVWYDAVMPHIQNAWGLGKQVIVVGGTGLYVKAITSGIETMSVPIDQPLRGELLSISIPKLQGMLEELDHTKFASLNNSDANNPRRLIRAIEIEIFKKENRNPERANASRTGYKDIEMIGLKYRDDPARSAYSTAVAGGSNHRSAIKSRVIERLNSGAIAETKALLSKYDQSIKSMTAIGYKSIASFIHNEITREQMIDSWVADELSYVKRQLTWFNKQPVIWYDVDSNSTVI